jgi:hypothetical protein
MGLNRVGRRGAVLGALAFATLAWSGCNGKKTTEFVAGFSTQAQVPRDLQSIVIRVDVKGENQFAKDYPVYDGTVRLPRTLGVLDDGTEDGVPVSITVYGFSVADGDPHYGVFGSDFPAPTVGVAETNGSTGCEPSNQPGCGISSGNGGARILRSSRQQYEDGQIIYVPMPLHYSCYDVDCGPQGQGTSEECQTEAANSGTCTCKAGQCVAPDTDVLTLPPYSDALIYGSTNTCFRPFSDQSASGTTQPGCMDLEVTPQPIGNPGDCIFALPGTASAADAGPYTNPDFSPPLVAASSLGGGLNVRAVFDNLVSEVLDYEGFCPSAFPPAAGQKPEEGYCNYADAPQKFRLAPGLCLQYLGLSPSHQITLLESSGACPSKTEFQPICDDSVQGPPQPTLIDGGQSADGVCNAPNPLKPVKSALYILFDKSSGMRDFFGGTGFGEVLGLSLTNPVFQQTEVGLMYTPALVGDCSSSGNEFATDIQPDAGGGGPAGTVPFEFSGLAQGDIANVIGGDAGTIPPGTDKWYLEAALAGAYTGLQNISGAAQYNRRAVMVFYDRDFGIGAGTDCPSHADAIAEATTALSQNGIETYAVYLASADFPDGSVPGDPVAHGQALAQGLTPGGQYFFNASSQAPGAAQQQALSAVASVVADLGSCVYDVPIHFVPGVQLNFPDYAPERNGKASGAVAVNVSYASSCGADDATTNPLYVFDNQRIRICQNTCERLTTSVYDSQIIVGIEEASAGRALPPLPVDVGWGYSCGTAIPDASIVESGSAPISATADAGVDASSGDGLDAATLDAGTD